MLLLVVQLPQGTAVLLRRLEFPLDSAVKRSSSVNILQRVWPEETSEVLIRPESEVVGVAKWRISVDSCKPYAQCERGKVISTGVHNYVLYIRLCGQKKLNRTLVIDSYFSD